MWTVECLLISLDNKRLIEEIENESAFWKINSLLMSGWLWPKDSLLPGLIKQIPLDQKWRRSRLEVIITAEWIMCAHILGGSVHQRRSRAWMWSQEVSGRIDIVEIIHWRGEFWSYWLWSSRWISINPRFQAHDFTDNEDTSLQMSDYPYVNL